MKITNLDTREINFQMGNHLVLFDQQEFWKNGHSRMGIGRMGRQIKVSALVQAPAFKISLKHTPYYVSEQKRTSVSIPENERTVLNQKFKQ